jgi:p-aminobenzoyl-glutamate transporter AbgT
MESAGNLNTIEWRVLALVFVAVLQVGVAEKDGSFSLQEREK